MMAHTYSRIFSKKFKTLCLVATSGAFSFCGINIYFNNEKFYHQFIMPLVHKLDPETSHRLAIKTLNLGFFRRSKYVDPPSLEMKLWDKTFINPVGIAAGFDKHGESLSGLSKIGFGFIEIGSVTPLPQKGNPFPCVFRLIEDEAVINRYGFNSEGHEAVFCRLQEYKNKSDNNVIIGINLGKNKEAEDAVRDYVEGVKKFSKVADYLVINISSPNTPGLRSLQNEQKLENIINQVIQIRDEFSVENRPPVLIKIAPDLSEEEIKSIATVLQKGKKRIDGIIISNTTIQRPSELRSPMRTENGGLSGKPLKNLSTQIIREMYKLTNGEIPIIGVGGISNGKDAYEKITAGASLVQVYSALVYHGFPIVDKIKKELEELLQKDGFHSLADAVGSEQKR